jgi:hypothetical protein
MTMKSLEWKEDFEGIHVLMKRIGTDTTTAMLGHSMTRFKYMVSLTRDAIGPKPIGFYVDARVVKFVWFDSAHNYINGVEPQPTQALSNYISDAFSYFQNQNIDDFQSEFGYEKASEVLRAYKGCKKAWADFERLGFTEDTLAPIFQKLQEMGL